MHPALRDKDHKVQSAARQARGVLVLWGPIDGVRTIEELADKIMPELHYPERLGAPDERREKLVLALYKLREARLLNVHRKTARARLTTKGMHADSLMGRQQRHSDRRHGRRAPEPSLA